MQLGDEIAVLEGFGDLPDAYKRSDVLDASSGANYSGGSSWAPGLPLLPSNAGLAGAPVIPPEYSMQHVLDASAGANYSGGSSWAPGLPLLPSSVGLAEAEDLANQYGIAQGVLPPRKGVLDASGGANYSGGSSWAPGLPLLPSNAGLAESPKYCGCPLEDVDKYWGSTMGVDSTHYSEHGVLDPSGGANYSGGSSYAPGFPLLPSSAGLAGLDAVSDEAFKKILQRRPQLQKAFQRVASKAAVMRKKVDAAKLQRLASKATSPEARMKILQALQRCHAELQKMRAMRASVVKAAPGYTQLPARPALPHVSPPSLPRLPAVPGFNQLHF